MEKDKIAPPFKLLVIGGSAGSIEVLLKILPDLHAGLALAIVVVLHRKSGGDYSLADLFGSRTPISVKEIEDKQLLESGCMYIAPPDYHLLFEKDNTLSLDYSEKVNYSRPSIDVSFESAAEAFGPALTCLLLSGANADGVKGLMAVQQNGGAVAVQDPETAESPFMPKQAVLSIKNINAVLDPKDMAAFINAL